MKPLFKNLNSKEDARSKVFLFQGDRACDVYSGQLVQTTKGSEVGLKYGYFDKSMFHEVRSNQGRKLLNTVGRWLHLCHRWSLEPVLMINKYETVENFSRVLQEEPAEIAEVPDEVKEQMRQVFFGNKTRVGRVSLLVRGGHQAQTFAALAHRLRAISFTFLYEGGRIFKVEGPETCYQQCLKAVKQAFPGAKPV